MEDYESLNKSEPQLEDLEALEGKESPQTTQEVQPIQLSEGDKTKLEERSWTDKPLPRLGLASVAGLLIFGTSQWVLPKGKASGEKPTNRAEVLAASVPGNSEPDPQDLCRDVGAGDYDTQEQNELLKTCGALASTEVATPPAPPKGTETKPVNTVKPVIRPSAVPKPKPARSASSPPVVARRLPAPRPQPVSRPATPVSKAPIASASSGPEAPDVDPYERWQQIADLGHTQSEGAEFSQASSVPEPDPPTENAVLTDASTAPVEEIAQVEPADDSDFSASVDEQSSGGSQVPIGTTVKAKLMMPITWGQEAPLKDDIFLAKLQESMGDLPEGAVLTLKASSATTDGLVKLRVESASVNGNNRLFNGAVASDPIRAKRKGTGKGIKMSDVLGVAIAGFGSAAEVINRPSESTTLAADGISQVVNSNDDRNLLAAIGEGAANQMLSQAQERVEGIESSGEPYFKVGEGKSITIRVLEEIYL